MNSVKKLLQFDFDAGKFARRTTRPITMSPEIVADLERIEKKHNSMDTIPE